MPDSTVIAIAAAVIVSCGWGVHATALYRELGTWRTDPTTGLPVLRAFKRRARRVLARPNTVVAFIDLDKFKPVNDTLDHDTGNEVLNVVGTRLREFFGPDAVLGRFGGDEFAVVVQLDDLGRGPEAGPWREHLSDLVPELTAPVRITKGRFAGRVVEVGASIGAVHLHGSRRAALSGVLNLAEQLMYEAKRRHTGVAAYLATPDERIVTTPADRSPDQRLRDMADADRPEVTT